MRMRDVTRRTSRKGSGLPISALDRPGTAGDGGRLHSVSSPMSTAPPPAPTAPASPAAAAASAPAAFNEASIAQALSFLKDARVVSTPTARKVEFLKKKGLDTPTIAEAFKRAYPNSNEWQDVLAVR